MTVRLVLLAAALALVACKREVRDLRPDPPVASSLDQARPLENRIGGAAPRVYFAQGQAYETNAYQLNQGKRLFEWFNCQGCHAQGGGVIGPALTNGWWQYGPDLVSIYLSIRDGRPHGMPAFGKRMTPDQIWQLTGYVRTLGSYQPRTAAPSRNDEMQARPAENRGPAAANITIPPSR